MERSVIFAVGASVAALLIVLELVRRRKLREDYSLLWLATAGVMFVLAASRDLLHGLSAFLGIAYPPNLLFLMATLFVLLILLYFSVVITRLTHENREIAQQIALLRYQLEHPEHIGRGEQVQPEAQHAEHEQQ
jgi:hypothetical protein